VLPTGSPSEFGQHCEKVCARLWLPEVPRFPSTPVWLTTSHGVLPQGMRRFLTTSG